MAAKVNLQLATSAASSRIVPNSELGFSSSICKHDSYFLGSTSSDALTAIFEKPESNWKAECKVGNTEKDVHAGENSAEAMAD